MGLFNENHGASGPLSQRRSRFPKSDRLLEPTSFFVFLGPFPATDGFLTNPADHEPTCLDIFGYRRPRTDRDSPPDSYRRDELRIGADENVIFEYCFVFEGAIVIAGDRTGANIDACSDFSIPDVTQMVDLAARGDIRFFDFDIISYVNAVRKAYPDVPGMADYCVYWIRKAHDRLPACTKDDPLAGRAGLVGTQNVRNNKSRVGRSVR